MLFYVFFLLQRSSKIIFYRLRILDSIFFVLIFLALGIGVASFCPPSFWRAKDIADSPTLIC